ncbi:MAG TPA: hypothetical protein VLH75_20490 [Longimicrobiales bacterium]|nr:hypothetical protein [Longimicrobiales bacterium]
MNPLRPYLRAVAGWHEALTVRATFEAYRVWRLRLPWRWLPRGPRFDRARAQAFRRFGAGFREVFIPAWVEVFAAVSGFRPVGVSGFEVATLLSFGLSERARHNLADRAEVELREIQERAPMLRDPEDPVCLEATRRASVRPLPPELAGAVMAGRLARRPQLTALPVMSPGGSPARPSTPIRVGQLPPWTEESRGHRG